MKLLRLLIGLMLLCTKVAFASGPDHIVERGFLKEVGADVGVQALTEAAFHPFTGVLALGYVTSTSWVKLRVRPSDNGEPLILNIRPAFLDDIKLFVPDPKVGGGWREQHSGDTLSWRDRPCHSMSICFEMRPQQETNVYLRVEASSTNLLEVSALTPRDMTLSNFAQAVWHVIYFIFMVWLLIWALFDYWSQRQEVLGWFVLTQAAFVVYSFAMLGYLAPLLPDSHHIDLLTNLFIVGAVATQVIFHHQFLAPFQPPKIWLDLLKAMIVIELGVFIALSLGSPPSLLLQINVLVMFATGIVVLPAAMMAKRDAVLNRKTLRVPYALKTVIVLTSLFPLLWGENQGTQYSLYGALVIGVVSAALAGYLLFMRSLNHRAIELKLAFQQKRGEEQALILSMLAHELKTPLAVLRSVLYMKDMSPQVIKLGMDSVQAMDGIIDKSNEAIRLESGAIQLRQVECDLEHILLDSIDSLENRERIQLHVKDSMVIHTDAALLRIILMNLIDNAMKYGDATKPIEIWLKNGNDQTHAVITVANAVGSVGWPDTETLFQKYQRGSRAHRVSGSGLGLYLARGFAQMLGAELHYKPDDQQVRFSLYLSPSTQAMESN